MRPFSAYFISCVLLVKKIIISYSVFRNVSVKDISLKQGNFLIDMNYFNGTGPRRFLNGVFKSLGFRDNLRQTVVGDVEHIRTNIRAYSAADAAVTVNFYVHKNPPYRQSKASNALLCLSGTYYNPKGEIYLLSDKICANRFFAFRKIDPRGFARFNAFEQPRHIIAERPHGLQSFFVLLDLFGSVSMHLVPVLR